jgi:hypothetical protein
MSLANITNMVNLQFHSKYGGAPFGRIQKGRIILGRYSNEPKKIGPNAVWAIKKNNSIHHSLGYKLTLSEALIFNFRMVK